MKITPLVKNAARCGKRNNMLHLTAFRQVQSSQIETPTFSSFKKSLRVMIHSSMKENIAFHPQNNSQIEASVPTEKIQNFLDSKLERMN